MFCMTAASHKRAAQVLTFIEINGRPVDGSKVCRVCGRDWICKFKTMIKKTVFLIETQSSYRKTSNISRTLVGNKIVDNSDVVGAAPTGDAPATSSFST